MPFHRNSIKIAIFATVSLLATSALSLPHGDDCSNDCRCFPGDDCWPSADQWSTLNDTVDGGLIATVPLAAVCYNNSDSANSAWPAYDEEACTFLRENWLDADVHYPDPTSIMAPFFANQSCDPFHPESSGCSIGSYAQYTIDATCKSDIRAGLEFAKENNIRLVIRNTGHDFNGKSSGAGSLAIWTSHFKDIEIMDWSDKNYTGKAMKMGAGVQGFEANKAAYDEGLQVVTGECPSVGVSQVLLADTHKEEDTRFLRRATVLEWEVITGTGEYLIATPEKNTDLYWALSGGGGGTYGIVLSMTVKAHADTPTAAANLTFSSQGLSQDVYYGIVDLFQKSLPAQVDAGVMTIYAVSNESFAIVPMMDPGLKPEQLKEFLSPLTNKLDSLNVTYNNYVGTFDSYTEAYDGMFAPILTGLSYATRLTPRDVMLKNGTALVDSYRWINAHGGQITSLAINASLATAGYPNNSVHPAWRDALAFTIVTRQWDFAASWESNTDNLDLLTNVLAPKLDEMIPNGATYLNEADFRDPNWKKTFYGENYDRLEAIKDSYDPEHIFYGHTVSILSPENFCASAYTFISLRPWARIIGKRKKMVVFAKQRDR
ncbi:hypothetical protein Q7P37_001780 [Cladosporium fusiforme]